MVSGDFHLGRPPPSPRLRLSLAGGVALSAGNAGCSLRGSNPGRGSAGGTHCRRSSQASQPHDRPCSQPGSYHSDLQGPLDTTESTHSPPTSAAVSVMPGLQLLPLLVQAQPSVSAHSCVRDCMHRALQQQVAGRSPAGTAASSEARSRTASSATSSACRSALRADTFSV